MTNQFGYEDREPNPPWIFRDVQNKCERCGAVFVGVALCLCPKCTDEPKKEMT